MPNARSFSERQGMRQPRVVAQVASMDDELRNGLWSVLHLQFWQQLNDPYLNEPRGLLLSVWVNYLKLPADTLSIDKGHRALRELFFKWEWNEVYDLIEFVANTELEWQTRQGYIDACNSVLARELAGYRFIEYQLVPIATDEELAAIEQANRDAGPYRPVRDHLRQAASLLSDRSNPDFRNSIKESISAVEAACEIVSGQRGTLGDCLNRLGRTSPLHPAFRDALSRLYGWTSDAEGIRHALMGESTLGVADARFMLVLCSGFVSYLLSQKP